MPHYGVMPNGAAFHALLRSYAEWFGIIQVRFLLSMNPELNNPLLRRYWFKTDPYLGVGVTAYSVEDARSLVEAAAQSLHMKFEVLEIIEDVDIRDLDQGHVVPNMGPPNFRGVWFPRMNL
jgi:hypothetical protein